MTTTTATTTANVPLAAIRVPSWNVQRTADDELVESVKLHGVLQHVAVVQDRPGRYRLVYGSRRLDAARKAGLSSIPATIYHELDGTSERILNIVENALREAQSPLAEGDLFKELVALGLGVVEVARRACKSPNYVRQRIRIASLCPQARAALDGLDYTPAALAILAALPPARQVEIIERRPDLLAAPDALREHLEDTSPDLSGAPFAESCTTCKTRTPAVCLDEGCFTDKLNAHVGREVARLRRTADFSTAPLVVLRETADPSPALRPVIIRHHATVLRDERPVEPGEDTTGSRPALLLDASGTVLPIRLVPVSRPRDGRALAKPRTPEEQARHNAQTRSATLLRAVAGRLDKALADAASAIPSSDLASFALRLASAVAGRDISDPAASSRILLDLAAPRLRSLLATDPIYDIDPDAAIADARRVLACLVPDPDKTLADLNAKADV